MMRPGITRELRGLGWICVLGGLMLGMGCGGDGGENPPPPTAESLTEEGWGLFSAGEMSAAAVRFGDALAVDSTYADAWNGLGWARAYLGTLQTAVEALTRANTSGLESAEAWAGLSAAYRDLPDLEMALVAADSALARAPLFIFSRRATVDSLDLHLLRGQTFVALGADYLSEAQAEADFLAPGNGLDPENPATWVVEGETLTAYSLALVRLFQTIEGTVGADLPGRARQLP